jgi:hypothetical protein
MNNIQTRIELLKSGKTLMMIHHGYGKYSFKMNPQQNVIFAEALDDIAKNHEEMCTVITKNGTVHHTKESIVHSPERMILWGYGLWKVEVEPPQTKTVVTYIDGVYEDLTVSAFVPCTCYNEQDKKFCRNKNKCSTVEAQ